MNENNQTPQENRSIRDSKKNETKSGLGRVAAFFEGKGFYIVLFLCIAAIGISGYVIFFGAPGANEPDDSSLWDGQIYSSTTDTATFPDFEGSVTSTADTSASESTSSASKPESSEANASVKDIPADSGGKSSSSFFVRPLPGAVCEAFSGNELVYNETMGDWRTHNGIDIAAAKGDQVKAVSEGKVSKITDDEMTGKTVIIEHANGYLSVYSNLQDKILVKEGDKVEAGTVIGGVGDTMVAEIAEQPHLHFEMLKDGVYVDPETILPKAAN